jgi:glucan phosphoethanolaminetransferase (alkaline phosphatase superfamily)
MVTRLISMPIQIWADPLWFQFVGDTLPEMIYASAWTMLVSFFVQLVGIATGTGTDTSPGIVIQATAYVVYICLIGTQIWNSVASILLYALLCCIYAALFGTVVYFCPRLLALLQPSLVRHSGLAVRLSICTVLCIIVFGAHTVGFARKVVAPPKQVYWWWTYGALELIPAAIFLIIMHPSSNKADRNVLLSPAAENAAVGRKPLRRSESGSSAGGNKRSNETKSSETTSLLKGPVSYGATTAESAA